MLSRLCSLCSGTGSIMPNLLCGWNCEQGEVFRQQCLSVGSYSCCVRKAAGAWPPKNCSSNDFCLLRCCVGDPRLGVIFNYKPLSPHSLPAPNPWCVALEIESLPPFASLWVRFVSRLRCWKSNRYRNVKQQPPHCARRATMKSAECAVILAKSTNSEIAPT